VKSTRRADDREIEMLIDGMVPKQISEGLGRVHGALIMATRNAAPDRMFVARLRSTLAREEVVRKRQDVSWRLAARLSWLAAIVALLIASAALTGILRINAGTRAPNARLHTTTHGKPRAGLGAYARLHVLHDVPIYNYSANAVTVDTDSGRVFVLASQTSKNAGSAAFVYDTATGSPHGMVALGADPKLLVTTLADSTSPDYAPIVAVSGKDAAHPEPRLQFLSFLDGHPLATVFLSLPVRDMAADARTWILYLLEDAGGARQGRLEARSLGGGRLLGAISIRRSGQGSAGYTPLALNSGDGMAVRATADAAPSFVVVDGSTKRAFVIDRDNLLNVIDISDPAHLRLIRTQTLGHAPCAGPIEVQTPAMSKQTSVETVGCAPFRAAIDDATNRVFMLDLGSSSVEMLDARTGALLRSIPLQDTPTTLAVSAGTGRVFVGTQIGRVVILDARTGDVLGSTVLPAERFVAALAVDETARRVYAMTPSFTQYSPHFGAGKSAYRGNVIYDKGWLTALDATTGAALPDPITLGIGPQALAVDPITGHVFVGMAGGKFTLKNDGSPLRTAPGSLLMLDVRSEQAPATSLTAPRVVVGLTGDMSHPLTILPSHINRLFCVADVPGVPRGTILNFHFQRLPAVNSDYYTQPKIAHGGVTSAFIYGPLQPGKWRCLVDAAGKPVGSAAFTIT
jgi:DNA-binding beta-propeller fold protein YncE